MKVSRAGTVPGRSPKKIAKARPSDSGRFASHLEEISDKQSEVNPISELNGASAVGSILVAQEVNEDEGRKSRRKLYAHGQKLLDRLEEIQSDLLNGCIPKERLSSLAQTLRLEKGQTEDPKLDRIILDIEVRAAVELAKYSRNS